MKNHIHILDSASKITAYSGKTGDILFVLNENDFYVADQSGTYLKVQSNQTSRQKPNNCKNCGAPLTSYKCEYCGTVYM